MAYSITSYGVSHFLLAGLRCLSDVILQLLRGQSFFVVVRPLVFCPQLVHDLNMVFETQGARHLVY